MEATPETYRQLLAGFRALGDVAPGAMGGFGTTHRAVMTDGALSTATKELMALVASIVTHCEGCITYHVHGAARAGAGRAEFGEALGVAVLMGGGPAAVYATTALRCIEEVLGGEQAGP